MASTRFAIASALVAPLLIASTAAAQQQDAAPAAASTAGTTVARAFADGPTRLLRKPTMSASQIAFEYANDIWVVARAGGEARRLTSG
jgi:tricorn protease